MNYLIIDTANTFFRCKHVVGKRYDSDTKIGLALHITLSSIAKMWVKFDVNHVVFATEGRSWRKDFYEPYKKNRLVTRSKMTDAEREEDELFMEAYQEMMEFIKEKSNCTVLHHNQLEADDLISGFIDNHPNDNHVIISSDSDFYQLLADNVMIYNGITETIAKIDAFVDDDGMPIIDKKTKTAKLPPDPEWLLFEKCMRGDKSDNVFSAYPGVRTKGSSNKIGLQEAYADRNTQGFAWNNIMLQRWMDHEGNEHRVRDDYLRNEQLIDLRKQPKEIRNIIDETVSQIETKNMPNIGIHFMKFCGKHDLKTVSRNSSTYARLLGAKYD